MVDYESLQRKEKSSWVIPKVVVVTYRSDRKQELFIKKFKSQFKQDFTKLMLSLLEVITFESRRKENFDCIRILDCITTDID